MTGGITEPGCVGVCCEMPSFLSGNRSEQKGCCRYCYAVEKGMGHSFKECVSNGVYWDVDPGAI